MFDIHRVTKLEVFSRDDKTLILASEHFSIAVDEEARIPQCHIIIKGNNLPELDMGKSIDLVANLINGDRILHNAVVDVSTEFQLNLTVNKKCEVLEERRRFYKVYTDLDAKINTVSRRGNDISPSEPIPATIKNINIGGVFLKCGFMLEPDDVITLSFEIVSKQMNIMTNVIRAQVNGSELVGYGCSFVRLRGWEEEALAQYIYKAQIEQKETLKDIMNSR